MQREHQKTSGKVKLYFHKVAHSAQRLVSIRGPCIVKNYFQSKNYKSHHLRSVKYNTIVQRNIIKRSL